MFSFTLIQCWMKSFVVTVLLTLIEFFLLNSLKTYFVNEEILSELINESFPEIICSTFLFLHKNPNIYFAYALWREVHLAIINMLALSLAI